MGRVGVQEAMLEAGWCAFIPALLDIPEHDSREMVLAAMETVSPACHAAFQPALPALRALRRHYAQLLRQEEEGGGEDEDDGFFQGMVSKADGLLARLSPKEEL